MTNTKQLVKELTEGRFENLEELAEQAGFDERIEIGHMEGTDEYLENLRKDREIGSIVGVERGFHGFFPIPTKDLNDYVTPYVNGFVRAREKNRNLEVVAVGTFTEEYVEGCVYPEMNGVNTVTPAPFLYLDRNIERDTLFPGLIDNSRMMKCFTLDERKTSPTFNIMMMTPAIVPSVGIMSAIVGYGLSYALKTIGVDIDSYMIDQGSPWVRLADGAKSALGAIGGISGLMAGTCHVGCNLIPSIFHWERNMRNKEFKYQKYAVKELISQNEKLEMEQK
jgi:hypothetical protein